MKSRLIASALLACIASTPAMTVKSEAEARQAISDFKNSLKQTLPPLMQEYANYPFDDSLQMDYFRNVEKEYDGWKQSKLSAAFRMMAPFTTAEDLSTWSVSYYGRPGELVPRENEVKTASAEYQALIPKLEKVLATMKSRPLESGESIEVIEAGLAYLRALPPLANALPKSDPKSIALYNKIGAAADPYQKILNTKLNPFQAGEIPIEGIVAEQNGDVYKILHFETSPIYGRYVDYEYQLKIPNEVKSSFIQNSAVYGRFLTNGSSSTTNADGSPRKIYKFNINPAWPAQYAIYSKVRQEFYAILGTGSAGTRNKRSENIENINKMCAVIGANKPNVPKLEGKKIDAITSAFDKLSQLAQNTRGAEVNTAPTPFKQGSSATKTKAEAPSKDLYGISLRIEDQNGGCMAMRHFENALYTVAPANKPEAVYTVGSINFCSAQIDGFALGSQILTLIKGNGSKGPSYKIFVEREPKEMDMGMQALTLTIDEKEMAGRSSEDSGSSASEGDNNSESGDKTAELKAKLPNLGGLKKLF